RRSSDLPRLVFQRAPLAALADPAVNQSWIDLPQLAIADAPTVPLAGRSIFDHHVGVDSQFLEDFAAFLALQVQRNRKFVAHFVQELSADFLAALLVAEHVLPSAERRVLAKRVSYWRFHLDDLGAQFAQLRRAP